MLATKRTRKTLLSLCREAQISTKELANESGIELGMCYAVEIGGFCREEIAERVLAAFNHLSQQQYTLEDIQWQEPVKWRMPFERKRLER